MYRGRGGGQHRIGEFWWITKQLNTWSGGGNGLSSGHVLYAPPPPTSQPSQSRLLQPWSSKKKKRAYTESCYRWATLHALHAMTRWLVNQRTCYICHYTKSNPIDDHGNISSKKLQKQNFKPLGHYTCMQCGTSHLQTVQENILSHIILATYRKFTVTTVRFTQNVSCNIYTHPIYQQVANVIV